ncbi:MAG: hypothetical protein FJ088_03530 [Deltaproteobacteria bacterium]|nr:hypothetical protein [Deltaproteobacteria bacterium]
MESHSFFSLLSALVGRTELADIYALTAIFLAIFIASAVGMDFFKGYRNRKAQSGGSLTRNVLWLLSNRRRHYFSYIMHLGVALSFIGFAGGAFKKEKKDVILSPGEGFPIGNYHIAFLGSEERFQRDSGFASITAKMLVSDISTGNLNIPVNSLKNYISGLGIRDFTIDNEGDFPHIRVILANKEDQGRVLLAGLIDTAIRRNYVMMSANENALSIYLRPYSIDAVQLIPQSIDKYYKEFDSIIKSLGDGEITADMQMGEPVFALKFAGREKFALFAQRMKRNGNDPAPFHFIGTTAGDSLSVSMISGGTGEILRPEMRFYSKHPNPTSEVDIRTSLTEDLYIAMAPAFGENSVSITAMVNPLIMFLWIGALIMSIAGIILIIPLPRQATGDS